MQEKSINRLRAIGLALPQAIESGGVGDPSFKARDKIFAMQQRVDERAA